MRDLANVSVMFVSFVCNFQCRDILQHMVHGLYDNRNLTSYLCVFLCMCVCVLFVYRIAEVEETPVA